MPRRNKRDYLRKKIDQRRGRRDMGMNQMNGMYPMDYGMNYSQDQRRGVKGSGRGRDMNYNDYNKSNDYDMRSDYEMDMRNNQNRGGDYHYQHQMPYHQTPYYVNGMFGLSNMDYARGGYDSRDYSMEDLDEEYEKDLEKWIKKLKKKDIFGVPEEKIIEQAEKMGIKFDEFDEEEFYATYLMMVSDYKTLHNITKDYAVYIHMAKDYLMDDDIEVSPSEKLYNHLEYTVLGKN